MPKRKEPEKFADKGVKDCWHTYSLQMLQPQKFNYVVSKILNGQYSLVITRYERQLSNRYH